MQETTRAWGREQSAAPGAQEALPESSALAKSCPLQLRFLMCAAGGSNLTRKGKAAPPPALTHRHIGRQSHALPAEFRSDLNVLSSAAPWTATASGLELTGNGTPLFHLCS